MKIQTIIAKPLLMVCAIAVSGCDGSTTNLVPENPSSAIAAEPADRLIRNSLLSYYTTGGGQLGIDTGGRGEVSVADSSAGASNASDSSRFSDTNIQEAGVDESDRIKIDGEHLFALDVNYIAYAPPETIDFVPDPGTEPGTEPGIVNGDAFVPYLAEVETLIAYKLDGDNSAVVSRLPLDALGNRSFSGMYLYKNNNEKDLILLSGQSFYPWESWGNSIAFGGLGTRLSWVDVSNPDTLAMQRTMDIQGHMISSRRVGDRLILVTRFHPQLDGIVPYANTDDEINNNRDIINNASSADLLPAITITENGDSIRRPLIANNQCYSQNTTANNSIDSNNPDSVNGAADALVSNSTGLAYPSPSVISIITIDLNNLSTGIESTCFVGETETLSVSPQSVYLATTEYNYGAGGDLDETSIVTTRPVTQFFQSQIRTDVHKFSFANSGAPVFKGSGTVTGHLGYNPNRKPFRMSEKDDSLRIITFDESRDRSPVMLNILQESGGHLACIATLPNDARPSPIGKPGESLYASRFIGDKAYLVTFRVTDPLYVLDVSNPRDPRIAGELEIPGYSDYLHPVNDSLLIGLGKDAIADDIGIGDGRGAWYQGVKIALYDVSDPANPFVADERILGKRGTESPALRHHHSFAYLAGDSDSNARLAIPMSIHNGPTTGRPWDFAAWSNNSVVTLEVDESSNRFVDTADWVFESTQAGFQFSTAVLENDRAVIGSDDDLYVIHNGRLHYGTWGVGAPSTSINR